MKAIFLLLFLAVTFSSSTRSPELPYQILSIDESIYSWKEYDRLMESGSIFEGTVKGNRLLEFCVSVDVFSATTGSFPYAVSTKITLICGTGSNLFSPGGWARSQHAGDHSASIILDAERTQAKVSFEIPEYYQGKQMPYHFNVYLNSWADEIKVRFERLIIKGK
jgi:hypothetical protein